MTVHHRSGQSIFTRPRPIDLSAARRAGYSSLDLDLDAEDDNEEEAEDARRPLTPNAVVFDADHHGEDVPFSDMPHVAQTARDRDHRDGEDEGWGDI